MPDQSYFSPLFIIGMFITFTELIAGYAIIKTQGIIQRILAFFVIAFPTFIAVLFFSFLWFKPANLYAPKDFNSDESFLSLHEMSSKSSQKLREAFQKVITELPPQQISNKFITVSFHAYNNTNNALIYPIYMFDSFQALLNELYFSINSTGFKINPFSYGKEWILIERNTGLSIKHMRNISPRESGMSNVDSRTLAEVGITAGTVLDIIRLDN